MKRLTAFRRGSTLITTMKIRIEILPFVAAALLIGLALYGLCRAFHVGTTASGTVGLGVALVLVAYLLIFFRDPARNTPREADVLVSSAEGVVASVTEMTADRFLQSAITSGLSAAELGSFAEMDVTRISVFLNLLNVHVNRAPMAGRYRFLGYFPGKHFFTMEEKSSEFNQHNAILAENDHTRCLIYQIVGPVCRRVVYWPDHDRAVELDIGAKIGMMKFGSRLDLYVPQADVEVVVKPGDRVRAGETIIARLRRQP